MEIFQRFLPYTPTKILPGISMEIHQMVIPRIFPEFFQIFFQESSRKSLNNCSEDFRNDFLSIPSRILPNMEPEIFSGFLGKVHPNICCIGT